MHYIAKTILHRLDVGDGWEVINSYLDISAPGYTETEAEEDLVQSAAMAEADTFFEGGSVLIGDFVIVLQAGQVVPSVYHVPEGTEYDVDIEPAWLQCRVLSAEEKQMVEAEEGLNDELVSLL